jgi:hypothetical protein
VARSLLAALLLAALGGGCSFLATASPKPEPTLSVDPLPGSFHLSIDPQPAPYRVLIRVDDEGGPSGRTAAFEAGQPVALVWSTLPLPAERWIDVNGRDCVGTFSVEERVETDLVLELTGDGCRITVVGSHPEGAVQHRDVVQE